WFIVLIPWNSGKATPSIRAFSQLSIFTGRLGRPIKNRRILRNKGWPSLQRIRDLFRVRERMRRRRSLSTGDQGRQYAENECELHVAPPVVGCAKERPLDPRFDSYSGAVIYADPSSDKSHASFSHRIELAGTIGALTGSRSVARTLSSARFDD